MEPVIAMLVLILEMNKLKKNIKFDPKTPAEARRKPLFDHFSSIFANLGLGGWGTTAGADVECGLLSVALVLGLMIFRFLCLL